MEVFFMVLGFSFNGYMSNNACFLAAHTADAVLCYIFLFLCFIRQACPENCARRRPSSFNESKGVCSTSLGSI